MKEKNQKNKSPPPPTTSTPHQRLRKAQQGPSPTTPTKPAKMKQSIIIDGIEIQYSIETKDIFAVLGSAYIYRPVTFLDTIRIIYRGLQRNCGYSFDEFQAAVMKGNIYPSKKRGHYPLSVATLRIRNREGIMSPLF